MREILFRGKRKDNGEWIEGDLLHDRFILSNEKICRIYNEESKLTHRQDIVIPETVGQYTGLNDNTKWEKLTKEEQLEWLKNHSVEEWNGKKIFEGDIVKKSWIYHYYVNHQRRSKINTFIGQIVFDSGSYIMKEQEEFIGSSPNGEWLEIIGNIHDNPELLKGGE